MRVSSGCHGRCCEMSDLSHWVTLATSDATIAEILGKCRDNLVPAEGAASQATTRFCASAATILSQLTHTKKASRC